MRVSFGWAKVKCATNPTHNCILFCFVIYDPSNTQNIYNVITKERSHRQTQRCSIKDFCYHVSHCGLSDSLSVTFNVVLIRTGKQKQLGDTQWTGYQAHVLKSHIADYQNHSQWEGNKLHRLCFVQQKQLDDLSGFIPHNCHGSHGYIRVNFFWPV